MSPGICKEGDVQLFPVFFPPVLDLSGCDCLPNRKSMQSAVGYTSNLSGCSVVLSR